MKQLGEFRQLSTRFAAHDAQVLMIFRETDRGRALLLELAREYDLGEVVHLALDPGAQQTARWSPSGFHTYLIDHDGIVRAVLQGATTDRPTGAEVLAALEELEE